MSLPEHVLKYYDRSEELTVKKETYCRYLEKFFEWQFLGDRPQADITTECLFENDVTIEAQIVSQSEGIVAGCEELQWYHAHKKKHSQIEFFKKDGDFVKRGDLIAHIRGSAYEIIAVERPYLNFLSRLFGIATKTKHASELIRPSRIAATRKTGFGLLDKKAVFVGGGLTHRLSLSDGILIKDSHLDVFGRDITFVLNQISKSSRFSTLWEFFVIELDSIDELKIFVDLAKKMIQAHSIYSKPICGILLDNFSSVLVSNAVEFITSRTMRDSFLIESSGGITMNNLKEYASSGVDVISLSDITMEPLKVDLSLTGLRCL